MSIENELDDLRHIKFEIQQLNSFSTKEAQKLDRRLNMLTLKINKMKVVNQEQMRADSTVADFKDFRPKTAHAALSAKRSRGKKKSKDIDFEPKNFLRDTKSS